MGALSRYPQSTLWRTHIMRPAIEATLIATFSVALTLLIIAAVFPRHVLGGGATTLEAPDIQPAVFVHGVHDRSGIAFSPAAPNSPEQADGSFCPYLRALAAASDCPAMGREKTATGCPYLESLNESEPSDQSIATRSLDI